MTLTYFSARSTWVAYAFEWVNLMGKTCKKLANGQDIDYSEEKKLASSVPILRLFSMIFKHNYWYIQISGEHLQDHWFSGFRHISV